MAYLPDITINRSTENVKRSKRKIRGNAYKKASYRIRLSDVNKPKGRNESKVDSRYPYVGNTFERERVSNFMV